MLFKLENTLSKQDYNSQLFASSSTRHNFQFTIRVSPNCEFFIMNCEFKAFTGGTKF